LREIPGIECHEPQGAFYVFPNIKGTEITSWEFQERGLEEAGVALLSGESFGSYGEGFVRLSYATSKQNIEKALERLRDWVAKAKK
jgi:aspartate/methionine/tyrosine aminotransferase